MIPLKNHPEMVCNLTLFEADPTPTLGGGPKHKLDFMGVLTVKEPKGMLFGRISVHINRSFPLVSRSSFERGRFDSVVQYYLHSLGNWLPLNRIPRSPGI